MARSSHGLQFTYRGGGIGGRGGGGGKKASWRIPPEDFVALFDGEKKIIPLLFLKNKKNQFKI